MKNKELKEIINKSLGKLDESYIVSTKHFDQPTETLSKATHESHYALYKNYVDSLNLISATLTSDVISNNSNSSAFRSLKVDETFNMNATYLHELYFANSFDPHSEILMESLAYIKISQSFGTFDDWQKSFVSCAMSSRQGWVLTAYSLFLKKYYNFFIDSHVNNVPVGIYPVIVVDLNEHSYFKDLLNDKISYLYSQMKELQWTVIEERFKKAEEIAKIIR